MLTPIALQIPETKAQVNMAAGINYMSSGNAWAESDTILNTDFARFKNDGITHLSLRIMWSVMMPNSNGLSTTALNNVKRVLNAAQNYGIKVNLDFWTQFGYTLGFPTSWAGTDYYSLLTEPTKTHYLNYMKNVVNQLKGYSAIESWSILNEPYYSSSSQKTPFQVLIADSVQAVKSVDNTRPVICRFTLSYTPGSGKYDSSVYDLFDIFAVTEYLDPANPSDTRYNGRWSYWDRTVADLKDRNKPLWVIEFGDDNTNEEHVRQHYELSLQKFQEDGVARAYAWAWQTRSANNEAFNIFDGSAPEQAYHELTKYPGTSGSTPTPTPNPTPSPFPSPSPTPSPSPNPTPSNTILEVGFETNNFNTWSSTVTTSGETARIVSYPVYAGAYSAQFTTSGSGGYESAYVYENLESAVDEVYVLGYFRVTQNGLSESGDRIKLVELRAGSAIIAAAGLWQSGSNLYWWIETRDGSSWVETRTSPVTVDTSEWFSLQIKWQNDATNGGSELWINGDQIYKISNSDTDNYGSCSEVRVGLAESYNCDATTTYLDNIKIATAYADTGQIIEPTEPSPTPPAPSPSPTPAPTPSPSPYTWSRRSTRRYYYR